MAEQPSFFCRIDICGQGINPGGAADLAWVRNNIFPKYLVKAFLGKDLPGGMPYPAVTPESWAVLTLLLLGFMNDLNRLIDKCHKNTYNYCAHPDRDAMRRCAKDQAWSLAVRSFLNLLSTSGKANVTGAILRQNMLCRYLDIARISIIS